MTLVIGIKCIDGIVLASDSQSEFSRGVEVKRLNESKIQRQTINITKVCYNCNGKGHITFPPGLVQ
jgi:ribosomal protein L18E